ncbi:MAG: hypothetical protein JXR19_11115 [Bacteroidia bacterium]
MKQKFNLDKEQTRIFIKYFTAGMKENGNLILPANSSERFENGYFLSEQSVNFKINGESVFVIWLLTFNSDHTLSSIANLNNEGNSDFELKISGFLNDILQNVLSLKRDKFFQRIIYRAFSGTNFMGEYWLQGIRFAQLIPEDNGTYIQGAERLLVFDLCVDAIDESNAKEIAQEKVSDLSSILSFVMNIGLEVPYQQNRFFLMHKDNKFCMRRESTQIISSDHYVDEMPTKGQLSSLGEFQGSVFDRLPQMSTLICPIETRKILKGITEASEEHKDAFRRCCKLYQLALNIGKTYPTVRISYLCAAVEAIVKTNQEEYGSFSQFMTNYSGENNSIHDFIYSSVRSAHFHSGSFELGEFNFDALTMNPKSSRIDENALNAEAKMRFAIFNWLNEKIAFADRRDQHFKPFETKRFSVYGMATLGKNETDLNGT